MKKLINTEAAMKKSAAYNKKVCTQLKSIQLKMQIQNCVWAEKTRQNRSIVQKYVREEALFLLKGKRHVAFFKIGSI